MWTELDGASIRNLAMLAGGWTLIAAGLLSLPLPAPCSTPALALGGMVLSQRSTTFRRGMARIRSRVPALSANITQRSRKWPRSMRYVVLRTDPRRISGLGFPAALNGRHANRHATAFAGTTAPA